ncbi:MAG: four helix bundle protein [Solirubrobacterales bacterium]
MKVKDYKDLVVWQKGIDLADMVYTVTDGFPREEIYGLTSQMRRAGVSVPSNVAEGFVRRSTAEYRQHLYVSLGSCAELDTQLIIAGRRKYIAGERLIEVAEELNHEMRMLVSLIGRLDADAGHGSRATGH